MEEKRIAFIGSTVVDVIVELPHLPKKSQDVNVLHQYLSLGGCAFNASWICHLFHIPFILFSPIGTGIYGDYIRTQLHERGLPSPFLQSDEENGCCYCLVEQDKERSFISYHGAEYIFKKEWFSRLDAYPLDTIYICGLEIEEESGIYIIEYMERHPNLRIYFAPGPRILHIQQEKMERILARSPILHINKEEALSFTHCTSLEAAAQSLHNKTKQSVIITLGAQGAYAFDHDTGMFVPSPSACQNNTIGAGDAHIGTIIACQSQGDSLFKAVQKANLVAHDIVESTGAFLEQLPATIHTSTPIKK